MACKFTKKTFSMLCFFLPFLTLATTSAINIPPPASYQSLQCPRHLRKLHAFRGRPPPRLDLMEKPMEKPEIFRSGLR